MPYYIIKPSYTANCKRFIHFGRDIPFNVIISAPARDIVNNTIIGTSISTGLAISPGRKPFRKTQKRTNSPKVQQFGVFSTHLDRRLLLSFANFRCTVGHPAASSSGPALNRPIRSRISRKSAVLPENSILKEEPEIAAPLDKQMSPKGLKPITGYQEQHHQQFHRYVWSD